jgi:hypothetical protein
MTDMIELNEASYYEVHLKDGTYFYVEFPKSNTIRSHERILGFECYECFEEKTNARYLYYCDRLEGYQFIIMTTESGETITLEVESMLM